MGDRLPQKKANREMAQWQSTLKIKPDTYTTQKLKPNQNQIQPKPKSNPVDITPRWRDMSVEDIRTEIRKTARADIGIEEIEGQNSTEFRKKFAPSKLKMALLGCSAPLSASCQPEKVEC